MSEAAETREVVVVGGGPAGSATAIHLARLGHEVVLLDEARFPRDKVCGEGVSPNAWESLTALCVADRLRHFDPQPLRGMRLVAADGTSFAGRYPQTASPGVALRRTVLDAALLDHARAQGVDIREGTRVVDVLRDGGRVSGVYAAPSAAPSGEAVGGLTIRAPVVVAADGRRSAVARRLGLLSEHRTLRRFAVRGYWDGVQGLDDHGEMHVAPAAYCGVAPLGATAANVTFVIGAGAMGGACGDLSGFYLRTLKRWPGLAERLERARLLEPPRAIGPLALVAQRIAPPGIFRVGDSAGFFDPFTGEGIAVALRCAQLAARAASHVLRGGGDASFGDYDRARRRLTRGKFRFNRLVHEIVERPWLGNALARRLRARPQLADRLICVAGDLAPARGVLGAGFVLRALL